MPRERIVPKSEVIRAIFWEDSPCCETTMALICTRTRGTVQTKSGDVVGCGAMIK